MPIEKTAAEVAVERGDVLPDNTDSKDGDEGKVAADAATAEGQETPSSDAADPQGGDATTPDDKTDDDGKKSDDGKDHRVPKARFDQAVNKERERAEAAERELKRLRDREQQQAQAANFEESQKKVKELLKEHSSLLADGELEKAADKMEEILQLRDDMTQARERARAESTRNATRNEIKYDATVERLEAEYPQINPDSEEFDEAAVRRVSAMVAGIMQTQGKDPAAALVEAAEILLKPTKEVGKDLRAQPSPEAVEQGLRRTQQQIDKNIATAGKQPPSTQDVGKDHDSEGGALSAAAVQKMSWEEFIKVPDSELAKMRGDFVN